MTDYLIVILHQPLMTPAAQHLKSTHCPKLCVGQTPIKSVAIFPEVKQPLAMKVYNYTCHRSRYPTYACI